MQAKMAALQMEVVRLTNEIARLMVKTEQTVTAKTAMLLQI